MATAQGPRAYLKALDGNSVADGDMTCVAFQSKWGEHAWSCDCDAVAAPTLVDVIYARLLPVLVDRFGSVGPKDEAAIRAALR